MITIFRNTLSRFQVQLLGWGFSIFLLGLLIAPFYDTYAKLQDVFQKMFEATYFREMMAFFGDIGSIDTPSGYLTMEYFSYMPLVLGIYAILSGSGLIAGDEESGTLDLVLAHPISRKKLFFGRLLAFCTATILILIFSWLGLVVPSIFTSLNVSAGKLMLPYLSLFAEMLLFGTLALMLSFLLPAQWMAAMAAGLMLVVSFILEGLSKLTDKLSLVVKFSPLHYYQSGNAINGLESAWFVGLLIVAVVFAFVAWRLFEHRDIRVSGEGSWESSALLFWRKVKVLTRP